MTEEVPSSSDDVVEPSGHTPEKPTSVLFVCTHNSARSIMAEALLRAKGGPAFVVASAGTEPSRVRPLTLRVLEDAGLPTEGLHSKSVSEFLGQRFDHVITVCNQARDRCPTFPGEGPRIHWDCDDPSRAEGDEETRLAAFRDVLADLDLRIDLFITEPRRMRSA